MININLIDELISIVKGLFLGVVLLFLGFCLVPDSIVISMLKRIKPNVLRYKDIKIRGILMVLVHGITDTKNQANVRSRKLNKLEADKKQLIEVEKNLFVIDSIIGILDTIRFLILSDANNYSLFEATCNYFTNYATSFNTRTSQGDEITHIMKLFYEFEEEVSTFRSNMELHKSKNSDEKWRKIDNIQTNQLKALDALNNYIHNLQKEYLQKIDRLKKELLTLSTELAEEL